MNNENKSKFNVICEMYKSDSLGVEPKKVGTWVWKETKFCNDKVFAVYEKEGETEFEDKPEQTKSSGQRR